MKTNKSCGFDNIVNEYIIIKSTASTMFNFYVVLLNKNFDSGVIPSQRTFGNINPLYKNKEDTTDLNSHRPIPFISCLRKLFTSILNERLSEFADTVKLFLINQAGLEKKYSTLDHNLTLYTFIYIS